MEVIIQISFIIVFLYLNSVPLEVKLYVALNKQENPPAVAPFAL